MDKNEDSLRSEEELDKIIPSPKNDNYIQQPFSPKNEYELNKVESEIDSFLNISDIKNDSNNNYFLADENLNKKTKAPFLSQNYIQITTNNINNLFEPKSLNEKSKKIANLRANEIFRSDIKNSNNQNFNIKLITNAKNSNQIFRNEKYKKIYRKLFLDDNEKDPNILLSSLSKKNINNLYNENFTPNDNKTYFKNKLISKNKTNKTNEIFQLLKNSNYNTEISDINYIGQHKNSLFEQMNKNNHISNYLNNIYTLNEISENFDRIFNKMEAKIKNKQNLEFSLKKPQRRNNNNYLIHSNKTSVVDLNSFLNNKNKILTVRTNINNTLSQKNIVNENEQYTSINRTNIINLKNKSSLKLNYKSSRTELRSSKINNNKQNSHIYSYNNIPCFNLKRNVLNFDFGKNSILDKLNKINLNY